MLTSINFGGNILQIILIVGALIITGGASLYIKANYRKNKEILTKKKYTGFDTAREILDSNGLKDVLILEVQGELEVAAHECGHAIQDKECYSFLRLRHALIPFVKFSSIAGYVAIAISLLAGLLKLLWIGIILECPNP